MYNAAATLPVAIESVLGQSLRDFEFLLLDDGSTDASLTIARAYAARDSRIRVIAMPRQGLVRSLNQLFAEARAPLVARFDADDICMAPRFEQQVAFLADHPDHGLVGCETIFIDENGVATDAKAKAPLIRPHSHEAFIAQLERGPILCHSAVMVRRDLVRAAGGYRESYVHAEDYDLWLRLSEQTRMTNLPEPLLAYRVSAGQVSSRHMVAQARNAAIAWLAHLARLRGAGDPTAGMTTLPDIARLDALFGPGSAAYVRRRMIERLLFSPDHLANEAWPVLLGYIADIGPDPALWPQLRPQLWRVALRLLRAGHPLRAAQAAMALLRHGA
jgi:glycosyltransferase involved in cell wall biosynthesis